jgi:hypothetical protein
MSMNALRAALEGLSSDEAGALETSSIGGEDNANAAEGISPDAPGGDIQALLSEATAQLESHYAQSDEVFTQASEITDYIQQNEAAHGVIREELKDLRNHVSAVTGSMEMLSVLTSFESVDPHTVMIANVALESLGRRIDIDTPSLEAIDGKITDASMEGLLDFLKAGANKVKNWFKTLFDNMALNNLRAQKSYATFEARIKRLQGILSKLPQDLGIPPAASVNYNDLYIYGLYDAGKPIEFTPTALTAAVKSAGALGMMGINENAKEHLANIKVISSTLPSLLMSIGDDGGEKACRDMVSKLALPPTLPKALNYGTEQPGGVTYRESQYRPSIRVASWAQIMVEMIERDRTSCQFRRTGRAVVGVMDVQDMEKVLDAMIDVITNRYDRYEGYWGELVEAYNDSVSAYNKTLGLAQGTDHSELTSEVWKAIDLASYAMIEMFNCIVTETTNVGLPSGRLLDSVLYVIEEQVGRYVKVNRV